MNEHRADSAGQGRPSRGRRLAGLSLAHLLVDGYISFPAPLLSMLAPALGVSYSAVSVLLGLNSLAAAVANVVVGLGSDRWRGLGSGAMLAAAALTVGCMSCVGAIPNYWLLVPVMLAGSFACGAFHPPAFAAAGQATHPDRHRGVSIVMATGIAACGLGPVFVSEVVHRGGLRATPWCAAPGLALVVAAGFLLRGTNVREGAERTAVSSAPGPTRRRTVWLTLLFANAALRAYAHIGVLVIVSYLAEQQWGLSVASSGWGIGMLQIGSGVGGLAVARMTRTGAERRTILVCGLLALATLVPMAFTSGRSWALWLFLYGFIVNGPGPVTLGLGQRIAPHRRALISGLLVGPTYAIGAALAAATTPLLIERYGQALTMAALAIPNVLAWISAWGLPGADEAGRE